MTEPLKKHDWVLVSLPNVKPFATQIDDNMPNNGVFTTVLIDGKKGAFDRSFLTKIPEPKFLVPCELQCKICGNIHKFVSCKFVKDEWLYIWEDGCNPILNGKYESKLSEPTPLRQPEVKIGDTIKVTPIKPNVCSYKEPFVDTITKIEDNVLELGKEFHFASGKWIIAYHYTWELVHHNKYAEAIGWLRANQLMPISVNDALADLLERAGSVEK